MFIYFLVIGVQVASLWNTREFVTSLILENLDSVTSIEKDILYSSIVICLCYVILFLIFSFIPVVYKSFQCKKKILLFCFFGYCFAGIIFKVDINRLPFISFFNSCYGFMLQLSYTPDEKMVFKQKELYGKNWVYQNRDEENVPNLSGKNIITLFTEGFSLKVIDKFNSYPNLTPNISSLMDRSLWFNNYYNHTATTYRGIRGSLSSSYQLNGVSHYENIEGSLLTRNTDDKVINIVSILRGNGYHTYFLSAHREGDVFNNYIRSMGFDRVYTAGDFKNNNEYLTDYELFQSLKRIISSGELKEPYFIAVYNLGTHYGEKSPYWLYLKNGEEVNELVNIMHNYDIEFGSFINWFDSDENVKKDTYIILTSDHMTFPDEKYINTFAEQKRPLNCVTGRIPFILYGKGIEHKIINANGKNSLDFAPTLLNWLRINDAYNYFLGCSLYDDKCKYPFEYIYAMSNFFYYNDCKPIIAKGISSKIINDINDFYNFSAAL
ncbi:MAG: sulfatase-like hydrolase/transferase [Alphaproteobacteria bacterium]|nr:sulfatase-like hydrolase/transferase [Alphaproteobacteria bacterium]